MKTFQKFLKEGSFNQEPAEFKLIKNKLMDIVRKNNFKNHDKAKFRVNFDEDDSNDNKICLSVSYEVENNRHRFIDFICYNKQTKKIESKKGPTKFSIDEYCKQIVEYINEYLEIVYSQYSKHKLYSN